MAGKDQIIVALDVADLESARSLVIKLKPYVGAFKIGLEFLTSSIVNLVTQKSKSDVSQYAIQLANLFDELEGQLFWDGKFNDIPNTIKGATNALVPLSPKFFDIHASSGRQAIFEAADKKGNSLLLGVTVLTSLEDFECISVFGQAPGEKVLQFAKNLIIGGADGIVCSPAELCLLREKKFLNELIAVTPNIRPNWAPSNDQSKNRSLTPKEAIAEGADYLVIGRPITKPPESIGSPVDAAIAIANEIDEAIKGKAES